MKWCGVLIREALLKYHDYSQCKPLTLLSIKIKYYVLKPIFCTIVLHGTKLKQTSRKK